MCAIEYLSQYIVSHLNPLRFSLRLTQPTYNHMILISIINISCKLKVLKDAWVGMIHLRRVLPTLHLGRGQPQSTMAAFGGYWLLMNIVFNMSCVWISFPFNTLFSSDSSWLLHSHHGRLQWLLVAHQGSIQYVMCLNPILVWYIKCSVLG